MKKKRDNHSRIPLAELIQEGCDTHYTCEKDARELVKFGLDWNIVNQLPLLTERCIRAETAWQVHKGNKKLIIGELQDMAKGAKKLRSRLSMVIRTSKLFIDSGNKLLSMSRNNKYDDIIQDLYELYVLAERMRKQDETSIADTNLIGQVLAMHHSLNEKLVKRICFDDTLINYAQKRDEAAKALRSALAEIHRAGKNAFIDDSVRASRYNIHYHQAYYTRNKHHRKKKR